MYVSIRVIVCGKLFKSKKNVSTMKQSNIHTQKLKFTNYFINNFLGYSMGWIVKKNSNET